jgi:hypothetical protein
MDDYLRTARRTTVGVSALGWIALLCLVASVAFWMALFIDLLAPPRVLSPQTIQAGLAVLAFSLVQPLLWSMLLPSSPAGALLQKQTWRTPGYAATIAAAVFLSYHSFRWLSMWWQAQPQISGAGEAGMLAITSMIAAVLMPALAWCVVTPEQWIAQIEQARHVKRIEMAMKMEEAAMRATYARGVALLNAGLSNLTIEQRKELAGILGSFARAQQEALQAIGQSWKDMYGVEAIMGGTPDQQLVDQYVKVVGLLTDGSEAMGRTADYAEEETREAITYPPRVPHVPQPTHVNPLSQTVQTRDRESGSARQSQAGPDVDPRRAREDEEARDMYDRLGYCLSAIFTAQDLATLMRWQDKRPAQRLIARWVDIGLVRDIPKRPGRYEHTDEPIRDKEH